MTVKELLLDPLLRLPINPKDSTLGFRKNLYSKLDVYLEKVKQIDDPTTIFTPVVPRTQVELLIKGLKDSIDRYLDGQPYSAYNVFQEAFQKSNVQHYLSSKEYPPPTNFYRLRVKEENYPLPKSELFHIAFDKRTRVKTQRYSIPGFPCIYLSNSIYVAWEEMGRPSTDKLQATRFENTCALKFLDLVTDIYSGKESIVNSKKPEELEAYVMAWPLIAACSVKVAEREEPFKPEYIIPQLILQLVRMGDAKVDAIQFSSTHIEYHKTKLNGRFYNLVIPVKESKDEGYCDRLSEMFGMTEVVSWQLLQASTPIDAGMYIGAGTYSVNSNVERLELIKGKKISYTYSPFGHMERQLNSLPAFPMTP